jgi:hypothetical protein
MSDSRDAQSAIDAAEQAAAAGDYESAEALLREAARMQEAGFGPLHPGLANTLNNLGIVCEIMQKPADAETFYRKACAIAAATLAPDDPLATTCRQNLKDFCEARGLAIESPAAPWRPAAEGEARRFAYSSPFRIIALSLGGLVAVMLMATASWLGSREPPPRGTTPAPAPSTPVIQPGEPIALAPKNLVANHRAPASAAKGLPKAPSAPAPTLTAARLCKNLSTRASHSPADDWRCEPASRTVDSGALFFYTRLKSPRDTTVEHRWYRGDRLYQAVDLRIRANQTSGYRTYSRYTVGGESAGEWTVQLRTRDGALLHEERFVVR